MSRHDRALYIALAAVWVLLGLASYSTGNVPAGGTGVWLVACTIPAGSLLAILRYRTAFAFNAYLWTVGAVAATRSLAYLWRGAWSPMAVWLIVGLTTVLALPSPCRVCRSAV